MWKKCFNATTFAGAVYTVCIHTYIFSPITAYEKSCYIYSTSIYWLKTCYYCNDV